MKQVLRQLREDGMVTFQDGFVAFDDYDKLIEFSEFDSTSLEQSGALLP